MKHRNLASLALKQIARHRLRTILTLAGVATGMFLFTAIETMQASLREATVTKASDTTLVVYRENRYCPLTSNLPEHYLADIARIEGVREVLPIQIIVNNCGASLDVIAFRGVPPERLASYNDDLEITEGSFDDWIKRSDAALVGEHFAARRGLAPGDQFEAVGVRVVVAGIVRSSQAQDNNVAYVHLPFLQQASNRGLGSVTQFNVKVDSADQLEAVADAIDEYFASDSAPTDTRPEKAFFAQTAQDLIDLIGFTRWLAVGAVLAVLALVANALLLVARGRVKENAILQTLGFPPRAVAALMVWEGVLLGLMGSFLGSGLAYLALRWQRLTLGNEGLTLALEPNFSIALLSLGLGLLLGLIASLWPAWVAARNPIIESLRQG